MPNHGMGRQSPYSTDASRTVPCACPCRLPQNSSWTEEVGRESTCVYKYETAVRDADAPYGRTGWRQSSWYAGALLHLYN